ncbi:MAG: hypothetical protein D4R67_08915 [Bacteroidetes bacterium]|nr:MAG: hypothetical protein D4R67_08915 [Bacteroidota bacterium]
MAMTDTPAEIAKKQLEIFLSKSETERFQIGDELNKFGRNVVESSIRQGHPGISETDLKIEVFKRCYSTYFTPEELVRIIISMKEYLSS